MPWKFNWQTKNSFYLHYGKQEIKLNIYCKVQEASQRILFYMAAHRKRIKSGISCSGITFTWKTWKFMIVIILFFSGSSLLVLFGQAAQRHAIILRNKKQTFIRSNETLFFFWLLVHVLINILPLGNAKHLAKLFEWNKNNKYSGIIKINNFKMKKLQNIQNRVIESLLVFCFW